MNSLRPLQTVFNDECLRVAEAENLSLTEVNRQLGKLVNVSPTWISRYRYGYADIPARMLPAFCRRFGNRRLLEAVIAQCEVPTVPEDADRLRLTTEAVRTAMSVAQGFIDSFEDGRVDIGELRDLEDAGARLQARIGELCAIARADYERKRAA